MTKRAFESLISAGAALLVGVGLLLIPSAARPETYRFDPKEKLLGWLSGESRPGWTRLDGPSQDAVARALADADRAMQQEQPQSAVEKLSDAVKFVESRVGGDDGALAHLLSRRSFAFFTLRPVDGDRALKAAIGDAQRARVLIARWFPKERDWLGLETGQLGLYLTEANRLDEALAIFPKALETLPPNSNGQAQVRRLRVLLWYADAACTNERVFVCNAVLAETRPLAQRRDTHPDDRLDFDSLAASSAFLQGRLGEGFASGERLLEAIGARAGGPSVRDLVLLQRYLWMAQLVGAKDEVRKSIALVEDVERSMSAPGRELGPESAQLLPSVLATAADAAMWLEEPARADQLADGSLAWMNRRGIMPPYDVGAALDVKGRAAEARGDYPLALRLANASIGMDGACARDFGRLARIHGRLADDAGMMAAIDAGLARLVPRGDCQLRDWEFFAISASALAMRDHLPLAVLFGEEAVERNEAQRSVLDTFAPERRADFVASRAEIYYALATWLSDLGRHGEAADVLSALKGVEADEYLRGSPPTAPVGRTWVNADERRARTLLVGGATQDSRTAKAAAVLGDSRSRPATAPAVFSRAVRTGDVVVNAWYHDTGVELQVWGPSGLVAHRSVPVSREELAARVDRFDTSLRKRTPLGATDSAAHWSRELGEILWKPIAADVASETAADGIVHLSLSGLLRRVPYAALDTGGTYVGEQYALDVLGEVPAAVPEARPHLASFGTRAALPGLLALPNAPKEAGVAVDLAGGRRMGNRAFIDADFTRASFGKALSGGEYSRVHLASHFILPPGGAAAAYLVLGDGGQLTVEEIAGMKMSGVSLAVLSACDSAAPLRGRGATGGELSSLSTVFQRRGARAVVASLWGVDDRSVLPFMEAFYRALWSQPAPEPAAALRAARRAALAGPSEYRHPYFWAAFVVQGS